MKNSDFQKFWEQHDKNVQFFVSAGRFHKPKYFDRLPRKLKKKMKKSRFRGLYIAGIDAYNLDLKRK